MERQKVYIEIRYECPWFMYSRTAIIAVDEREGWTFEIDYVEEAKEKLFAYLYKERRAEKNDVLIHDWKYHGLLLDIIK